jgi:hypothetical protein
MKSILLKTLLIINLFFIYNCKAQTITTNDYIAFYNDVVPKLNSIVPIKTQFYGQNFSNFYNELQNKNIDIVLFDYDTKTDPGTKYYILRLFFSDNNMWSIASENSFRFPKVVVTFKNEIPQQIETLAEQNNMRWTYNVQQFFLNMKIEKIDFVGVKGYDSDDYSE